ncbi:MAG: FG-GAP-like repeat-containing protein [Planctomycetota bacterium]|jgi:hypothetical protein
MKRTHCRASLQYVLTAAGLAIILPASPVDAAVVHVNPGGQGPPDIQSAIDTAAHGDTVLVAEGIYAAPIDFKGKAITVEGYGATIVGNGGSVVVCDSGEGPDTRIIGFTITGGSGAFGGGMYIGSESSPTVIDCTFTGNTAAISGGGLYVGFESSPTIVGCAFVGNTAGEGGGMANWFESSPVVLNCTFAGNASTGDGGGMHNASECSPEVTGCTFDGNTAGGHGGAMANGSESNPVVSSCIFTGNAATGDGGAMANWAESSPVLTNCVFQANTAGGVGGVLANSLESNPRITNCTLSGNAAGATGGAMACSFESNPIISNSIFWGNSPSAQIHVAVESEPIVSYSCIEGGWMGVGNLESDPRFANELGPDGLPATGDEDLRLGAGSPCIDAGDNTAVPSGLVSDLDGNPRFIDAIDYPDHGNPDGVNPLIDMGAYETAGGVTSSARAYVLWRHRVTGQNSLWMMNGRLVLPESGSLARVSDTGWFVAGMGDFNGDGRAHDILWRHEITGENAIWLMDGLSLLPGSGSIQATGSTDWIVAGTGDFNGDGRSDILWRHQVNGRNALWLMDAGTRLSESGLLAVVRDSDWRVAGTGDFNGDGKCDILWRNRVTGRNALWLMDGLARLPESGSIPTVDDTSWAVVGIGDFNGDGYSDILWRHLVSGSNSLWLMSGTSKLPESDGIPAVRDAGWTVVGTVDFDDDGRCDILWRHLVSGKNTLWLMSGTSIRQGSGTFKDVTDTDWMVVATAD